MKNLEEMVCEFSLKKEKNKLARRRRLTCSLAQLKDSGTGGGVCMCELSLLM